MPPKNSRHRRPNEKEGLLTPEVLSVIIVLIFCSIIWVVLLLFQKYSPREPTESSPIAVAENPNEVVTEPGSPDHPDGDAPKELQEVPVVLALASDNLACLKQGVLALAPKELYLEWRTGKGPAWKRAKLYQEKQAPPAAIEESTPPAPVVDSTRTDSPSEHSAGSDLGNESDSGDVAKGGQSAQEDGDLPRREDGVGASSERGNQEPEPDPEPEMIREDILFRELLNLADPNPSRCSSAWPGHSVATR